MTLTSQRSRTRVLVLLATALAASCNATATRSAHDGERRGDPLELDRLQLGSVYGVGSRFASDGIEFVVDGFGEGLGNTEISAAHGDAFAAQDAKKHGKALLLSHATLRCQGKRTDGLEFEYFDNGGPVALEIAGQKRGAEDFIALDGMQLGEVRVAVVEASTAGVKHGRVKLTGRIEAFAIAGADLEVAELRVVR